MGKREMRGRGMKGREGRGLRRGREGWRDNWCVLQGYLWDVPMGRTPETLYTFLGQLSSEGSRLEQRTICLIWCPPTPTPQGLYLTSHATFKRYHTQNLALQGHANGRTTWWVQDFKKHCPLKISTGRWTVFSMCTGNMLHNGVSDKLIQHLQIMSTITNSLRAGCLQALRR